MNLDKYKNHLKPELHGMLNDIQQSTGKKVDKLPALNSTAENARFLVKQSDGTFKEHIKLNGSYQVLGGTAKNGTNGENGTNGADGIGVPAGGTTGQILAKKSNTDYDTEWEDGSSSSSTKSILLADKYNVDAVDGILICEKYDPAA
jgi:hypothetical protein